MPRSGGVGVALGYSSTLYSVTRFDAMFWTTRVVTRPLQRYATIRKRPVQAATDSRLKARFSAAVVDLTVARMWDALPMWRRGNAGHARPPLTRPAPTIPQSRPRWCEGGFSLSSASVPEFRSINRITVGATQPAISGFPPGPNR